MVGRDWVQISQDHAERRAYSPPTGTRKKKMIGGKDKILVYRHRNKFKNIGSRHGLLTRKSPQKIEQGTILFVGHRKSPRCGG